MAAKVCAECNKTKGVVGCNHWELWPENLSKPHNWKSKVGLDKKTHCLECGLETTIPELATGKTNGFDCPRYKIQKPKSVANCAKPVPKRVKLKVVNAFKSGEHQILWLAGGMAIYQRQGVEEIFETLDEAMKHCPVDMTQDLKLIERWKTGYELPADEHFDWPANFLADEK